MRGGRGCKGSLGCVGVVGVLLFAACRVVSSPASPAAVSAVQVSDLHNSVLYWLYARDGLDGLYDTTRSVHAEGIRTAGGRHLVLSLGIPRFSMRQPDTVRIESVLAFLRAFRRHTETRGRLRFADNQADATLLQRTGFTTYSLALEGSHLLRGDPTWLDSLYAAGVRMVGIGHRFHNAFLVDPGGSSAGASQAPSMLDDRSVLSDTGRSLIERIVARGIVLDVSHLGTAAFREVVAINAGRVPLVASHGGVRALCDTTRNLDDDQLRMIAASGGLVGVSLHSPLLTCSQRRATMVDVVAHIDHLLQIVGADHVALGTDLEGLIRPPEGLATFEALPRLAVALKGRGHSDDTVERVMSGNVLRILPAQGKAPTR